MLQQIQTGKITNHKRERNICWKAELCFAGKDTDILTVPTHDNESRFVLMSSSKGR